MGAMIEFYSCDESFHPGVMTPVDAIEDMRQRARLVGSISINSVVVAATLAPLERTPLAGLIASVSPVTAAVVIDNQEINNLLNQLDAIRSARTDDLVDAVHDAADEVTWRHQALGIVLA
jgi:hypothetical protein